MPYISKVSNEAASGLLDIGRNTSMFLYKTKTLWGWFDWLTRVAWSITNQLLAIIRRQSLLYKCLRCPGQYHRKNSNVLSSNFIELYQVIRRTSQEPPRIGLKLFESCMHAMDSLWDLPWLCSTMSMRPNGKRLRALPWVSDHLARASASQKLFDLSLLLSPLSFPLLICKLGSGLCLSPRVSGRINWDKVYLVLRRPSWHSVSAQ